MSLSSSSLSGAHARVTWKQEVLDDDEFDADCISDEAPTPKRYRLLEEYYKPPVVGLFGAKPVSDLDISLEFERAKWQEALSKPSLPEALDYWFASVEDRTRHTKEEETIAMTREFGSDALFSLFEDE